MLVGVDRELLTKRELDDCLLVLTANQGRDRGDEDRRVAEQASDHIANLSDRGRIIQIEFREFFLVV